MAHYDDRIKGIKNVSFDKAVEKVKHDLRRRLVKIYFKDEPEFVRIIEDDDAYERILADVLDSDDFKECYAIHCRRRCVVRFAGMLFEYSESFPPRVANRVALELGVKHIALFLKRSKDFPLTTLQRLKLYNKALKMEMTMLREDLEWNDDLNDDMFNEIQRFERNVERERVENEKLLLKGKSRKAEIELLQFRLLDEFGVEAGKKEKPKKIKGKKPSPTKSKQKSDENEDDDGCDFNEDEDELEERVGAMKISTKRGFTAIVKD